MPAVKFFACLDLDQICDGHQFGRLIETGMPDEFFDNPQSARAAHFISKILSH